ncbi:MAG: hypothetical protein HYY01_14300 [Chloroflexi bacterium]|nr:hypothetical protein [Chloroflexota bacterium]
MRGRLRQWRALLSVEAVLLLLVLIMAGAVLYQGQKAAGLRAERAAVEGKLAQARESLAALQDPAALRQQIQELQASPQSQTLPTRWEALALSTALTDYAARSGLRIVALSTAEGTIPGAMQGETAPAVKVTLEVEGPLGKLIGILGTVQGFPTAMVQSLGFSAGDGAVWNAKLELAVAYSP